MSAVSLTCSPHTPTEPTRAAGGEQAPAAGTLKPVATGLSDSLAMLVGAGDIAMCGVPGSELTAALLDAMPGVVFTIGDHVYMSGTSQEFRDCYDTTWGRHRARTRPVPGNHDYETPGAAGYFAYFGASPGQPGAGYYGYDAGSWRVFALNSNIPADEASLQYQWLQGELETRPARCTLAYWHHPVLSYGANGNSSSMRAIWRLLHRHGAELVLNGHDHVYERFAPLDGDLRSDPRAGIREIVVGTGGATLYPTPAPGAGLEASAAVWGVLRLTLQADAYEWEFIAVPGSTFHDSGRAPCH